MANNMIFSDIPSTRRVLDVGTKVAPGTPGVFAGKGFVTLTGSGDNPVIAHTQEGLEYTLRERGGVGLEDFEATCAFSGSFAFDVADADDTVVPGDPVYLVADANAEEGDNVATGTLTVTASGTDDVLFGYVDFFRGEYSATDTVVKIGL